MNIVGKELISLANKSDLIKKCLGIPKDFKNICYIGHNTVHQDLGNGKKRGIFYGKRKFKNYITTNMLMNLEREGVFKSLEKRFGQEIVEEYMNEHLLKGSLVKYGSGSFNPDASPESTSVDGYLAYNADWSTWATLHDAATGTTYADSSATAYPQIAAYSSEAYWRAIQRLITLFDTSSIGSGQVVDSADYKLYVTYLSDELVGADSVGIVSCNPASNTALSAADYDQVGTTRFATDKTLASMSTSAYSTWALNSAGKSAIAMEGITKFSARIDADIDDVEPTWSAGSDSAQMTVNMADNGSNEPTLDVTWSTATNIASYTGVANDDIASVDGIARANIASINSIT